MRVPMTKQPIQTKWYIRIQRKKTMFMFDDRFFVTTKEQTANKKE
jgi:hypothetical protein